MSARGRCPGSSLARRRSSCPHDKGKPAARRGHGTHEVGRATEPESSPPIQHAHSTRILTAGGTLLAAAGLAAAIVAGPAAFADDAQTPANVEVASTIELTGDGEFTIVGAPGDEATSSSGLAAETNNTTGYNVTVLADSAELTPEDAANSDSIPVSSLQVNDSDGAPTALDTDTAVTVHTQAERSVDGGDDLTANYSLDVPFVNADTYSGGLTFTATANG